MDATSPTTGFDESFAHRLVDQAAWLLPMAERIVGEGNWAEDAVAETFLKAWAHRRSLRDDSRWRAWLASICRRVCFSLVRKRRRYRPLAEGSIESESLAASRRVAEALEQDRYRHDLLEKLPGQLKICAHYCPVDFVSL